MPTVPGLQRVEIMNYRSLAKVVVDLGEISFLVGPNGSGKSNFLDALRFVSDALNNPLEQALRDRGGIDAVRRKSIGHPNNFGIRLGFTLSDGRRGSYSFEVTAGARGGFKVKREKCSVKGLSEPYSVGYEVKDGEIINSDPKVRINITNDRLILASLSGVREFRPVFDFLANMRFYNINPEIVRSLQDPNPGSVLRRDGSNSAAVLRVLERNDRESYDVVCRYLSRVVPGIKGVSFRSISPKETLDFFQDVEGATRPWRFAALNMSDGTLRVLGVLLAIFQQSDVPVIGIEEPEATVHPAAAELLVDILMTRKGQGQLIVTTHSPDILDSKAIHDDQIFVVQSVKGITTISPLGGTSREAVKKKLFTFGDLLRMDELVPDTRTSEALSRQMKLHDF